jgi:hypothetical protein
MDHMLKDGFRQMSFAQRDAQIKSLLEHIKAMEKKYGSNTSNMTPKDKTAYLRSLKLLEEANKLHKELQ